MACLYVATAEHAGFGVLKYGIASADYPEARIRTLRKSRHNDLGALLGLKLMDFTKFFTVEEARQTEAAIKRRSRKLQTIDLDYMLPHGDGLFRPLLNARGSHPSCEWMLFDPRLHVDALIFFFAHAAEAVRGSGLTTDHCLVEDEFWESHDGWIRAAERWAKAEQPTMERV